MIPKVIHYCWFGEKEMPVLAKKCLKSWKKYCPDYKIVCWNEENFDINSNKYVKEAYENKKFAFVTDYVRLYALYNYGGIYMDTDVEVLKPLDKFIEHKAFSGFESDTRIPTGIMASEKGLEIINELLNYYKERNFVKDDGSYDLTPNTITITNIFERKGLKKNNVYQEIQSFALYPSEYFCPIDVSTRKKNITVNSYTIHWFSGSWLPFKNKFFGKICFWSRKILGERVYLKITQNIKKIRKGKI